MMKDMTVGQVASFVSQMYYLGEECHKKVLEVLEAVSVLSRIWDNLMGIDCEKTEDLIYFEVLSCSLEWLNENQTGHFMIQNIGNEIQYRIGLQHMGGDQ